MLVFFLIGINVTFALSNPAVVYCEELGYEYEIVKTSLGEKGVCVLPDKECGGWDFFTGKCGQEYSYCAKQGYDIETLVGVEGLTRYEYAACVLPGKRVAVADLMNLDEKLDSGLLVKETEIESSVVRKTSLPSTFDWSHQVLPSAPPDDGENWITPPKNQLCNDCWAHASIAVVEAKTKISSENPDYNPDLSVQDLVSCGVPHGFYVINPFIGGCHGAFTFDALNYIKNTGVIDRPCLPYTGEDDPCDKCLHWGNRRIKIDNFYSVPDNPTDMKNTLIENGPFIAGLYMKSGNPGNSILTCERPFLKNHAVIIVGYNDNENENYWIAKNNWGPDYGINGYFKIGYGECNIGPYFRVDNVIEYCGKTCGRNSPVCCCFNKGNGYYYWRSNRCNAGEVKVSSFSCNWYTACGTVCGDRIGTVYQGYVNDDACCCRKPSSGCGGGRWMRCVMLGDYEIPLEYLLIPVVIIVAVFGVFKFFAKRT